MTERLEVLHKDPDDVLDYLWDWTEWLANENDTISSSTFTVETGLTKNSSTNTTTTATVWLSGGTAGQEYDVTNRIVTTGGRTKDETRRVVVSTQ